MGTGPSCNTCTCNDEETCCAAGIACEERVNSRWNRVESRAVLDRGCGIGDEPVGQVFEENLCDVSALDAQLLIFCATTSLAVVRWLLKLGARVEVCDTNGTTCLHAACRSGSVPMVRELIHHEVLLNALDVASWTPLHIAAHMGRKEVVAQLLSARAEPDWRNVRGQMPSDLCLDASILAMFSCEDGAASGGELADIFARKMSLDFALTAEFDSMGASARWEPECFFVDPPPALRLPTAARNQLFPVADELFALRPSHGLAFVMLAGMCDSYTRAMRLFLRTPIGGRVGIPHSTEARRRRLGVFLGESFSICGLLRFTVFESLPLLYTGVVSALSRSMHYFRLPDDLSMLDRLLQALAQVWWRKHTKLADHLVATMLPDQAADLNFGVDAASGRTQQRPQQEGDEANHELVGMDLKQYFVSSHGLHQLMLSAVLLHWYVHADGGGPRRCMPLDAWVELNRGLELGGASVPDHVQRPIHSALCDHFHPELSLAPVAEGVDGDREGEVVSATARDGDCKRGDAAPRPRMHSGEVVEEIVFDEVPPPACGLSAHVSLEGWVRLLDDEGVPVPGIGEGICEHATVATSSLLRSLAGAAPRYTNLFGPAAHKPALLLDLPAPLAAASGLGAGAVFARLCGVVLMLAEAPGNTPPHALVNVSGLRVVDMDRDALCLTLALPFGAPRAPGRQQSHSAAAGCGSVALVHLLPDARWRNFLLPSLRIKVPTGPELDAWASALQGALPDECRTAI